MDHLYHRGWDCICDVAELSSGGFQAVIRCKSLTANNPTITQVSDSQRHETAAQAIAHARAMAIEWTDLNRDHL